MTYQCTEEATTAFKDTITAAIKLANAALPVCLDLRGVIYSSAKNSSSFDPRGSANDIAVGKQFVPMPGRADWSVLTMLVVDKLAIRGVGASSAECSKPDAKTVGKTWPVCRDKDAIVVLRSVLSNRTTLTHEVGHWLGLRHTFHGCGKDKYGVEGDGIQETEREEAGDEKWEDGGFGSCDWLQVVLTLRKENGDIGSCKDKLTDKSIEQVKNWMEHTQKCRTSFVPEQEHVIRESWKDRKKWGVQ